MAPNGSGQQIEDVGGDSPGASYGAYFDDTVTSLLQNATKSV
ncbi:hypothetical protein ACIGXM_20470 [Kitasatospora sp. NPDC052896]